MFSGFPEARTDRLTHRHLPAHSQHHGPPFLKPAIASHPSGCCDCFQKGKSKNIWGGLETFDKIRQLGTEVLAAWNPTMEPNANGLGHHKWQKAAWMEEEWRFWITGMKGRDGKSGQCDWSVVGALLQVIFYTSALTSLWGVIKSRVSSGNRRYGKKPYKKGTEKWKRKCRTRRLKPVSGISPLHLHFYDRALLNRMP